LAAASYAESWVARIQKAFGCSTMGACLERQIWYVTGLNERGR
jgi:hypothetical protein